MQAVRKLCINPDWPAGAGSADWPAPAGAAAREILAVIGSLRAYDLGFRA